MSFRNLILTLFSCIALFYQGKAQDLQVTGIPSLSSGCNLSCCAPVTFTIYNNPPTGVFFTNVDVSFSINGGPPTTESFVLTLPSGGVYTYTFFACANLCNQGTYVIHADVNMAGDLNTLNDSITITIVNDTTVVPGNLMSSDTVCASGNSGNLNLTGFTGYVGYWQSSIDGGTTWDSIPNTTSTQAYANLTTNTIYQVFIDGGFCPDDWSPWAVITVDDTTEAGSLVGNATVCSTGNSGQIDLAGYTGSIIDWEFSTDGGSTWNSLGVDTNFYDYTNLTTTTIFHALVQNGVCPMLSSSTSTITVNMPPIPGSVTADATVCSGFNSDSLFLVGYSGTINSWISSTNGGATYSNILNTTFIQPYSSLTATTMYCAILQNGVCPADTSVCATVTVVPNPVASAGLDTTISLGDTVCFLGSGGIFYNWTPPLMLTGSNTATPCIYAADSVGSFAYTLTVTNAIGCTDTDVMTLTVLDTATTPPPPPTPVPTDPVIVISNFLTPNGDGDNDVWNIFDINSLESMTYFYPDNEVIIMNNHGQILYTKAGYTNDWTGDDLPDGSYYYIVEIKDIDKTYKGVLTISSSK